jgi:hypothetical protein
LRRLWRAVSGEGLFCLIFDLTIAPEFSDGLPPRDGGGPNLR